MSESYNWHNDLEEYTRQGEPEQAEKSAAWQTAIGLQAVDGLEPSGYLIETAKEHISGAIDMKAAQQRIHGYYEARGVRSQKEAETREADIVSARIAELLSEKTFQFSYADLSVPDAVRHIAKFTSGIWQIHPFCEGNTRATAVFVIKYLRTFGFSINNTVFAENSWFFRNALVRANYNDLKNGVHATTAYLEAFFENLLFDAKHDLKNRYLHIDYAKSIQSAATPAPKCNYCTLNCTLDELAVLQQMKKNPKITQKALAQAIGKSERTVKSITVALQKKGFVRRFGGKRSGEWEIVEL